MRIRIWGGTNMTNIRDKILNDINLERDRQDALHPQDLTLAMRFVTIMEEAGEVAEALQDKDYEQAYKELIETASCCVRMAEQITKIIRNEHVADK